METFLARLASRPALILASGLIVKDTRDAYATGTLPVDWGGDGTLPLDWGGDGTLPVDWGGDDTLPLDWGGDDTLPLGVLLGGALLI
jgi:hypothetical protein